jgi:hypothetical protein
MSFLKKRYGTFNSLASTSVTIADRSSSFSENSFDDSCSFALNTPCFIKDNGFPTTTLGQIVLNTNNLSDTFNGNNKYYKFQAISDPNSYTVRINSVGEITEIVTSC